MTARRPWLLSITTTSSLVALLALAPSCSDESDTEPGPTTATGTAVGGSGGSAGTGG
ncbi:MAG: hypothetical protein JRI23_05315, partial [Deltaproteobacteria bacterium]|nr:hypothetical protein [Deltaproteobacteria bacterium]MBW2530971.1 hypothetical protein [Deltaproteobacteria bacterium]